MDKVIMSALQLTGSGIKPGLSATMENHLDKHTGTTDTTSVDARNKKSIFVKKG